MEFKAYHKIKQFKDVIRDINFNSDGDKPTLEFKGTVKLHGTNAGICYTPEDGIMAQKRSSFSGKDLTGHFGFNAFVHVQKKEYFEKLLKFIYKTYCVDGEQVTLYGEWAGKGVQKSVGISEFDKSFYIFDAMIYNPHIKASRWIDTSTLEVEESRVFNIYDFKTYSTTINFNKPADIQNTLIELTDAVESECPVSEKFGLSKSCGEGIVWTSYWKGDKYIFKVKGGKHSVTRVKKLAAVDPELIKSISEFVEYACTENRINQGIQEVSATEKKHVGDLLRWIANDIISEETDVLIANSLEWKNVAREVSFKARNYYFNKLNLV